MIKFALAYAALSFVIGFVLARMDDEVAPYFPAGIVALLFPPISIPAMWIAGRLAR